MTTFNVLCSVTATASSNANRNYPDPLLSGDGDGITDENSNPLIVADSLPMLIMAVSKAFGTSSTAAAVLRVRAGKAVFSAATGYAAATKAVGAIRTVSVASQAKALKAVAKGVAASVAATAAMLRTATASLLAASGATATIVAEKFIVLISRTVTATETMLASVGMAINRAAVMAAAVSAVSGIARQMPLVRGIASAAIGAVTRRAGITRSTDADSATLLLKAIPMPAAATLGNAAGMRRGAEKTVRRSVAAVSSIRRAMAFEKFADTTAVATAGLTRAAMLLSAVALPIVSFWRGIGRIATDMLGGRIIETPRDDTLLNADTGRKSPWARS